MFRYRNLSLAQKYMLVSFLVMTAGMLIISIWVARQIEEGVTNRTAAVTALYVDSYVTPYMQELAVQPLLAEENVAFFDRLLSDSLLGQEILSFKVWTTDGTIAYSADHGLIGQNFPVEGGLAEALSGQVYAEISPLERDENVVERQLSTNLIEIYAPVRQMGTGEIIGVSEFYQSAKGLLTEIRSAQIRSSLVVAGVISTLYLLLAGLVKQASNTIQAQQTTLRENVNKLNQLLNQNTALHERVRRAAARTTALNERYLRRISSDLHDGPAQDLALALLRIESLAQPCRFCVEAGRHNERTPEDFRIVRAAMESALQELRTISAGLRMPEIQDATIEETVRRAVRDYEQKTGCHVALNIGSLPPDTDLSVKITLYRVIKEALNNGYHHANGRGQTVEVRLNESDILVQVADQGDGFIPQEQPADEHLGLVSMAERVEVLGGDFELESAPGQGTIVRALLPLTTAEVLDV